MYLTKKDWRNMTKSVAAAEHASQVGTVFLCAISASRLRSRPNDAIREHHRASCSHAWGDPKYIAVLCSRIGEPRWAAMDMAAHAVNAPAVSIVVYAST